MCAVVTTSIEKRYRGKEAAASSERQRMSAKCILDEKIIFKVWIESSLGNSEDVFGEKAMRFVNVFKGISVGGGGRKGPLSDQSAVQY